MVKSLLIFLLLIISTSTWASFSFPDLKWEKLSQEEKTHSILILRQFVSDLDYLSPEEVVGLKISFIQEAYAAGFDCFVAGWPSSRNSQGRCQSPVTTNPSYQNYIGCSPGLMLCNPTLYGDDLCIKFKTSSEKNSATNSCEKAYQKEGRLFSEVLDGVGAQEFNELVATVYQSCHVKKDTNSRSALCVQLKRKLQHFVPDETPHNYDSAVKTLDQSEPDKILKAAENLQSEMQIDLRTFQSECQSVIANEKKNYCKNLAIRVKKADDLLPRMFKAAELRMVSTDCVNCSQSQNNETVVNSSFLSDLSVTERITCSDAEKQTNSRNCDRDVMCAIGSSVFSCALWMAEAFGQKPSTCISSQNDCMTNMISAMVDSLVSLVTGLWDILGDIADWSGEKLSNFWDYVTGVEDKTADAQLLLNKMSDADVKQVKTNPIQWVTNFAKNIWSGIKLWMKEDIFCEKWAGIPRATQCLQPAVSFECLSCRTMIAGTCSAGGVIVAEILPAFLTGGSANLVARAGDGAKIFAKAIKSSKAYGKVIKTVDRLAEIKAIQLAMKGGKGAGLVVKTLVRPVEYAVKYSLLKAKKAHGALKATKAYQVTAIAMNKAAKYTGVKYVSNLMDDAYEQGYKFVDDVAGGPSRSRQAALKIIEKRKLIEAKRQEVSASYEDIGKAYEKGFALKKIGGEIKDLKNINPVTDEIKLKITELDKEAKVIQDEIAQINKKFVHDLHEIYKKDGIPSLIVEEKGHFGLQLDFSRPPSSNLAIEFYKKASKRFGIDKVTINLENTATSGALGFFSPHFKRMEIGPGQGLRLLEDYVNSTGKHELRHSMFLAKKRRGEESVFQVEFHASQDGKNLLNDRKMYDGYMSAEEVYTFSTDLQTLAQVFKGDNLLLKENRYNLLNQLSDHNESLVIVSKTSKDLCESMLETVDNVLTGKDTTKYGVVKAENGDLTMVFTDRLGRSSEVHFVSPEEKLLLKPTVDLLEDLSARQNKYLDEYYQKQGKSLQDVQKEMAAEVSNEKRDEFIRVIDEFGAKTEIKALSDQLDSLALPAVEKAKKDFANLKRLSEIQIAEATVTEKLLKAYGNEVMGGKTSQLKALKDQLFKVGKNVKEGYKGYALAPLKEK